MSLNIKSLFSTPSKYHTTAEYNSREGLKNNYRLADNALIMAFNSYLLLDPSGHKVFDKIISLLPQEAKEALKKLENEIKDYLADLLSPLGIDRSVLDSINVLGLLQAVLKEGGVTFITLLIKCQNGTATEDEKKAVEGMTKDIIKSIAGQINLESILVQSTGFPKSSIKSFLDSSIDIISHDFVYKTNDSVQKIKEISVNLFKNSIEGLKNLFGSDSLLITLEAWMITNNIDKTKAKQFCNDLKKAISEEKLSEFLANPSNTEILTKFTESLLIGLDVDSKTAKNLSQKAPEILKALLKIGSKDQKDIDDGINEILEIFFTTCPDLMNAFSNPNTASPFDKLKVFISNLTTNLTNQFLKENNLSQESIDLLKSLYSIAGKMGALDSIPKEVKDYIESLPKKVASNAASKV